ncbi:hypothetical protein HRG84_24115 [Flavisolibacter sp. BT320]|nr:hypothetical protein [Flavisolibacter longurius]
MLRPKQLIILLLTFIILSCNSRSKYPNAIKDFRVELQPFLIKMVEKGIVMHSDSALRHMATDKELVRLGKSEHPILRAAAFREMFERKSFNDFDILMEHLDDTALVFTDAGEFGIWDRTVSDDILQEAGWKTLEAKNKTVEQVLSKHNYLRSAYIILDELKPQEKYYPFIKDMATRPRRLDPYEGYELGFGDIEYALYGLAKYKKTEDVSIIKEKLMAHVWKLSDVSFRLMKEFTDSAYMDVLQDYHRRQFYRFSGNRPHGFSGFPADRAAPEDFIQALVVQQNESSAKLLDTMLTYLPKYTCMPDKESIINEIITAIWEHPCPAYTKLRQKIKPKAEELLKGQITIPIDRHEEPIDTTEENYRWYP